MLFSKETDRRIKRVIIILFFSLFSILLIFYLGYSSYIKNIGYRPSQPIEFSHKLHAGQYRMKCIYCHHSVENSAYSSLPTTRDCMVCHVALNTESKLMIQAYASYDQNIPIKWNRVYRIPDYSHFNHSRHIRAQIDCSSCHGELETMEKVYQVRALTMKWCLDCHRDPVKFIIPAREISGIFTTIPYNSKVISLSTNQEAMTSPYFGEYMNISEKPLINNIFMPKLPGYGPENCSACHF